MDRKKERKNRLSIKKKRTSLNQLIHFGIREFENEIGKKIDVDGLFVNLSERHIYIYKYGYEKEPHRSKEKKWTCR